MNLRSKELAKIHMAKAALGMDDDTYKALLKRITGRESAADLNLFERGNILDEFKKLGWHPKPPKQSPSDWRAPRIRFIQSLWRQLCKTGMIKTPTEDALLSFCRKLMKVERLEWASSDELNKIIEALKNWQNRVKT